MNRVFKALQQVTNGEPPGATPVDKQDDRQKSEEQGDNIRWSADEEDSGPSLVLGALAHGSVSPTIAYQPPVTPEPPSPTIAYVPGKSFQDISNPPDDLEDTASFASEPSDLHQPDVAETTQYRAAQSTEPPATPAAEDRDRSDKSVLDSLESAATTHSAETAGDSAPPPRQLEIDLNARLAEVPEISNGLRQLTDDIQELLTKNGKVSVAIAAPQPSSEVGALVYLVAKMLSEQSDSQMLMVDGSISSSILSRYLQARECSGVCDFLRLGSLNPDWIMQLSSPNMHFLPAGDQEQLRGEAHGLFPELINILTVDFPILLIDAGSEFDGVYSTWATSADSTYLAVQLGATEVEAGRSVAERIQRTGAKFSGTIICQ